MSETPAQTSATPVAAVPSAEKPIPFSRLVAVEWRKMHDTRSGFWLLLLTGALVMLFLGITILVGLLNDNVAQGFSFDGALHNVMLWPVSLLVPVLAITSVTSEWSQRTALTTFTVEPNRGRVLLAKGVVTVLIAITTVAVAVGCAALATVVITSVQGTTADWDVDVAQFLVALVVQILLFLTAFGLGMCFLSSPAAIAVFYVLTVFLPYVAYAILYLVFDWFRAIVVWVDFNYAARPWTSDVWPDGSDTVIDGLAWARLVVASLIWLVLPLGIGARRIMRAEVK